MRLLQTKNFTEKFLRRSKASRRLSTMQPVHSQPRLKRIVPESKLYAKTGYRSALKNLLGESQGRCGYSMQHVSDFGLRTMEVDHFNPTLKHPPRNLHGNLIAASRHCNGFKSETWPSERMQQKGIRFLNPYSEGDYGVHIIEERSTGLLKGKTPAGRWHIEMLDLNAEFLVQKRLDRTKILTSLKKCAYVSGADPTNGAYDALNTLLPTVKDSILLAMIPEIPDA